MNLLLLGVNHHTTALDTREALAFAPAEAARLLASLVDRPPVHEAAVVCTCNRTEFYLIADDEDAAELELRAVVASARGADLLGPASHRYVRTGPEAVTHLFRVACGLDSMVLGDVQILGQVKDAYLLARGTPATGPMLDRLFETALHAGKRARAETTVGAGTVSVSSAAVTLAARTGGGLSGRRVLVIGAGETARLAALHARQHGPAGIEIANRTLARGDALAAEAGGAAYTLDAVRDRLVAADVVFSATRAPCIVLSAGMLEDVMAERAGRPLVIFDLALPRDVEPSAARIAALRLHTLDDIRVVVDGHLAERQAQVPEVERIVSYEAARYMTWLRGLAATSTLVALRDHFERIRLEELRRLLPHASEGERTRADRLTRALVNRLLHVPTLRLKDVDPTSDDGRQRLSAARDLFALGEEYEHAGSHDA